MSTHTKPEKPLTIIDVARILGVSKSTVSAAFTGNGNISRERQESVRQAALALGYQPNPHAQGLIRGHRNDTVALFARVLDTGAASHKLRELQRLLFERGYMAPIYAFSSGLQTDPAAQRAMLQSLREMRPRAIACNVTDLDPLAIKELHRFQEEGGVIVAYDYALPLECDQVHFDREHNTYTAMRHLLELGHRDIGFALGISHHSNQPRMKGLLRALEEFDTPLQKQWLKYSPTGQGELLGPQLAEFFLAQKKRPTAMCIVNDYISSGFVFSVQRQGIRVPDDLSIVSHDDLPIARIGAPLPLTTVSQPVDEIAKHVARLLTERLEGAYSGPPRSIEVRGELKLRETTAPLHSS